MHGKTLLKLEDKLSTSIQWVDGCCDEQGVFSVPCHSTMYETVSNSS
jgi:hypothetical protein